LKFYTAELQLEYAKNMLECSSTKPKSDKTTQYATRVDIKATYRGQVTSSDQ